MRRRAACFWATPCGRGCSIGANYQSTTVHLPPALATGNLDIIADAHVREVTTDKNGKANGVLFIDKTTGKEERVNASAGGKQRRIRTYPPQLEKRSASRWHCKFLGESW